MILRVSCVGARGTFVLSGLPPLVVNVLTTTYHMPLSPAFVIVGTAAISLIAAV